jgi:hypothetical protein
MWGLEMEGPNKKDTCSGGSPGWETYRHVRDGARKEVEKKKESMPKSNTQIEWRVVVVFGCCSQQNAATAASCGLAISSYFFLEHDIIITILYNDLFPSTRVYIKGLIMWTLVQQVNCSN